MAALMAKDAVFKRIHSQFGPPPEWERPQGFRSLVRIIIEQHVSLSSAEATFFRLENYCKRITPERMMRLSDLEFRTCTISRQKTTYIKALSEAVYGGEIDLADLENLSEEESGRALMKIKGIGPWSASIYRIFCLKSKDVFPPGDVALINAVLELKNPAPKSAINDLVKTWKPLRSLSAFYLWHYYLRKRNRNAVF